MPLSFEWSRPKKSERVAFKEGDVRFDPENCQVMVRLEPGRAASLGYWRGGEIDVGKLGPVRLATHSGSATFYGWELRSRIVAKGWMQALVHKGAGPAS